MPSKRSRARKRNNWIILLLLTVVFLLAALSCVLLLRLNRAETADVTGKWLMRPDLTERARGCAELWLRGAALGDRVDVGAALPRLEVKVLLSLQPDGTWTRRLDGASYESARENASRALADALHALLLLRLEDAGLAAGSEAETQAHIRRALGMSIEDYLALCGPQLLPAREELESRYGGSGSYALLDGEILFDGRERADCILAGDFLILSRAGGREVYERA